MKNIGKPCAGKPHARFDEGGLVARPALYSTHTVHFSFVFRNEGNEGLAIISGFISGFTLTVIPAYAKDNFILTTEVKQGDRVLKTYSYRDHMNSWIQLLPVFLTPTHWPGDVAKSIIDNMVMNFVHDFAKDAQSGAFIAQRTN